jgi:hypothetical protein
MPSFAEKSVFIDANPIPVVSIRPSQALRVKNKILYINANDKIVLHGSCSPTPPSTINALLWSMKDTAGKTVDMNNSAWFSLGSSSPDFVLQGGSDLLFSGDMVSF